MKIVSSNQQSRESNMNRRDAIKAIAVTTTVAGVTAVSRVLSSASEPIAQADASYTPAPTKLVTLPTLPPASITTERLLATEPTVEIAPDGKATVSWKTAAPIAGATLYLGVPSADQQLDYPIYSSSTQVKEAQPLTEHQAIVDLQAYSARFAPSYLEQGEGVIWYRLEMTDPDRTVGRLIDRTFRFVKEGDRFRKGLHIVEGPFVAMTTKDRATLWWKTDQPSQGGVKLQNKITPSPAQAMLHTVTLESLQPGQLYNYQVTGSVVGGGIGDRVTSKTYCFRTEPANGNRFSFAFTCDGRTGALGGGETAVEGINLKSAELLAAGIHAKQPAFMIFTGDLISGYTTSEADFRAQLHSWKQAYAPLWHYIPIYPGVGNHESLLNAYADPADPTKQVQLDKSGSQAMEVVFASEFVNPENSPEPEAAGLPPYKEAVYSFDYGNAHFCQLSSDYWYSSNPEQYGGNRSGRLMDGQLRWFAADLKAARDRGIQHLFVFIHQPAFPNGGHVQDSLWDGGAPLDTAIRDRFWQIASEVGVVAVFSGHEHNYSRTLIDAKTPAHKDGTANAAFKAPVWQILQGAAGAPFYMQDKTVPWFANVKKFVSPTWAYSTISIQGSKVSLETHSYTGELLDSADLAPV
jgi:3',5'-cyclic AMP phosphodiesterase CpdA